MREIISFSMLLGIVTGLLMLGSLLNELLTRIVGKFFAYVIMLAGFGILFLYLGFHGAGPSLVAVGVGCTAAALVFTGMLFSRRRCNG